MGQQSAGSQRARGFGRAALLQGHRWWGGKPYGDHGRFGAPGGDPPGIPPGEYRAVESQDRYFGAYHAFKFAQYVHRYLAEVQYRFNRRFDLSSILARLVRVATLTGPRPESMIRLAEVGG